MNLLTDDFISTTAGKISLKTLLTSEQNYQLQYFFDETQLAMLQMLSSLATVVLKPTLAELRGYLKGGVNAQAYVDGLAKVEVSLFDENYFMRSTSSNDDKAYLAPITKMVSGVECGSSANALGLFSEIAQAKVICPDCTHVLNYNLHMNIKGECFSKFGATGIRGGGAISTLISANNLKRTVISNIVAYDHFNAKRGYESKESTLNDQFMWQVAPQDEIYFSHDIGLHRGLFALAYHVDFSVIEENCMCDVCGHQAQQSVKEYSYIKYKGSYGSTKKGRDANAGWWPHPYTPITLREEGVFPICARDQNWQSWQQFTAYVIGSEMNKATIEPAYIIEQYLQLGGNKINLLVGGNIADQGSITGRVYDLYSMPSDWNKNLSKVTQVIDAGLAVKEKFSLAFNKIFGVGYDKNFVGGIKEQAMNRYTSNAQQIIQQLLLDVDKKETRQMRKDAIEALQSEAKNIYSSVIKKYQHDLPLFKALIKGEVILRKKLAN